ncbi:tripartite tricarboxylate transporter permease [Spiractinospora alimapuensis]|uniref:tripartite tricarboxylate transporter permease n=1 Tax=Spiractinospora alimapuensis TaxID=2820884 RepID=UPI001F2430BA|nr:tripartite tricarboxylate transporter permease [Spiractinospora alimapuensis]QVQ52354.1 tripartite tricarboxylate transporter permease [Spiractinospora alimapuensis]
MELFDNVVLGFQAALSWDSLLFCALGVTLGTFIGVLPGLGSATGVALLLPLTLGMEPLHALLMLAGIYYGCQYGASTSAVLIRTPGDPASAVVTYDGYPMARQGRAGQALAVGTIASFIAGTLTVAVLMLAAPAFAAVAVRFGAPEMFALMLLGLLAVAGVSSGSPLKGLAMAALGLAIATVGIDSQTGVARFTFGQVQLYGGFGFIEIVIGIFAIGELLRRVGLPTVQPMRARLRDMVISRRELRRTVPPALRHSVLGFLLGILPGGGATLASFLSYETERRISKNPEEFGKGRLEGVAAPEASTNAAVNGSFVPTLTLGVPGSGTTAILLGAFIVFGIVPGPMLMREQPELVWGLMASFWIGNLLLLALNLPLAPAFASVLRIPYRYLYPAIILLTLIGAFSIEYRLWGMWVALAFGLIGWLMMRYGYPVAPVVLGLVLGPLMEPELARSLTISYGDPLVFVQRPISAALLALGVLLLVGPTLWRRLRRRRRASTSAPSASA